VGVLYRRPEGAGRSDPPSSNITLGAGRHHSDTTCQSERWRLEAVLDRTDTKIAELQGTRRHVRDVMTACDSGNCAFAEPSPQQAL
jgi:hypothetical protein